MRNDKKLSGDMNDCLKARVCRILQLKKDSHKEIANDDR